MNFKKHLIKLKDKNPVYYEYENVKIKGKLHYQSYVDDKWVFYIKKCVIRMNGISLEMNDLKLLLLKSNYNVKKGYQKFEGVEGTNPLVLSPELEVDSIYKTPNSYGFGEYTYNNTRRTKYRTCAKKIMILSSSDKKIYIFKEVSLDLQF